MQDLATRKADRAQRVKDSINPDLPADSDETLQKQSKASKFEADAKDANAQPAAVKKAATAAQWQPNATAPK